MKKNSGKRKKEGAKTQIHPVEIKTYDFLSLEEDTNRRNQYQARIEGIIASASKFQAILNVIKEDKIHKEKDEQWRHYLECDGIPRSLNPAEIREFLQKWEYLDEMRVKKGFCWSLEIDEKSILTQDLDAPNLTLKNLQREKVEVFEYFREQVERMLKAFNNFEVLKSSKIESHSTYEELLQVEMELPFEVLEENLTVRGMHLTYDHYSEFVKTFNLPNNFSQEEDLTTVLVDEWKERQRIENKVIEKLNRKRAEYEEWLKEKEIEEGAKNRKDGKRKAITQSKEESFSSFLPKKAKKRKKDERKEERKVYMVEPPKIPQNMLPDIENDFIDMQNTNYENFLRSIDPEVYDLDEGEINLREYILLGGIYEFNFLENPNRILYPTMVFTRVTYPVKLQYNYKNCQLKVDQNILKSELPEIFEPRLRGGGYMDEDSESSDQEPIHSKREKVETLNLFIITFKIPQEICKWSLPIVCQFFDIEEYNEMDMSETIASKQDSKSMLPVAVNDFVLSPLLERQHFFHIVNHIAPRMPSTFHIVGDVSSGGTRNSKRFGLSRLNVKKKDPLMDQNHGPTVRPERLFPIFEPVRPIIVIPMEQRPLNGETEDSNMKTFSEYLNEITETVKSKYPVFKESLRRPTTEIKPEILKDLLPRPTIEKSKSEKSLRRKRRKAEVEATLSSYTVKTPSDTSLHEVDVEVITLKKDDAELDKTKKVELESQSSADAEEEPIKTKMECPDTGYKHPKWSTKNIFKSEFDEENRQMRIWTNRLGVFSFAYKRYTHLPFKDWYLGPHPDDPTKIRFSVLTGNLMFIFEIMEDGFLVEVSGLQLVKGKPVVHFKIEDRVSDLDVLIKRLQQIDLNIFPERDAVVYIEKALEKHLALEFHTYNCMAATCVVIKCCKSKWNRVTNRRVIHMKCGYNEEEVSSLENVIITPEECKFVKIRELCTDLDQVVLSYEHIRQEGKYYPDLLHLLDSFYYLEIKRFKRQMKNPKLQYNVVSFLKAVRPLSFAW